MELPKEVEELMMLAVKEAAVTEAEAVEPLHLFIAVCKQKSPAVVDAFTAEGVTDLKGLRRRVRAFAHEVCLKELRGPRRVSGRVLNILDHARLRAINAGQTLDTSWMLIALLEHADSDLHRVIQRETLAVGNLVKHLEQKEGENAKTAEKTAEIPTEKSQNQHSRTPTLDSCGKDYTALARAGKLSPVIGRREEIKQVVRVLLQKQKNNPALIGEAGVGKTSIVEGLAQHVVASDAPAEIREMRIVELMLAALVAGTKYRGEFEERLQKIIAEVESDPNLIIFIDEIHALIGAGSTIDGTLDAATILKPALARGTIRCIGATTTGEYRYIEKDPALERRFQPIRVEEPTPDQTRNILLGLRAAYESHHKVEISDEAIDAAIELSVKHLPDRRLPDKACDLIDRAAANERFLSFTPAKTPKANDRRVGREEVAQVVAAWTGIPVERLTTDQRERLLEMEATLRQRVIGQDHAVAAVAQVVQTSMAGLSNPGRPNGVFLFMGPTGVGKTELAKALAEFLFGDERRLLRFDMSEYLEEHSVSKLVGAPPGYVGHGEGGLLTAAVRKMPYSVLLFDEIEKAHPRVSDIFLQIFDDGRLTDAQGRTADFRNTIIILTTNLSETKERKPIRGFRPDESEEAGDRHESNGLAAEEARKLLLTHFRPELINRLSRVIHFRPLGQTQIRSIIDKIIARVQERLHDKKIELQLVPSSYDTLMELGYKPEWGAREMERVIEQQIVQPLAQGLLDGRFTPGSVVYVVPDRDGVALSTTPPPTVKSDNIISLGEVLHTTLRPAAREKVAMLLIDIVKSTEIVRREGDTALMYRIRRINEAFSTHPLSSAMRFLKFTGDGFLAVYNDVGTAFQVANALRDLLRNDQTNLRFIIHCGAVKIDFGGDPVGAEVHRLFRIEALDDARCVARGISGRGVPEHSCVVITPTALAELSEELRARFELLGKFRLKGFEEPEEIWAEKELGHN
jgi:ATP-dependent Clp protease ATP-binding subunit ClpC